MYAADLAARAAGALKPDIEARSVALERAAYEECLAEAKKANVEPEQTYAGVVRAVQLLLDQEVCAAVTRGELYAGVQFDQVDAEARSLVRLASAPDLDEPRSTIRVLLATMLVSTSEFRAKGALEAAAIASKIETSCYNATIQASKKVDNPPARSWASAQFTAMYGARCGTVIALIDPEGGPTLSYGPIVVSKIARGELPLGEIGFMTSAELCPESSALERATIARRMNQKIESKESTLFACPHCGERRCVYQEVQRRGLDEAPDYDCVCLDCKRRFSGRS
jgi:DNA-directed RNA polymerase subunit M/transcription elongation factor TFIIS